MPSVRIWALESENDARAVQSLAYKLIDYHQLSGCSIRTANKTPKHPRKAKKEPKDVLKQAVRLYLQQDDFVIFVIDTDGPISSTKRRQEANSLINQAHSVLQDKEFDGKVFLAETVPELEGWLLIDCAGIFHHYSSKRKQYRQKTRLDIIQHSTFGRVVRKHQKGNTELLIESELGGNGSKEYLIKYTEDVLLALNPKLPRKNLGAERYTERLSPEIANSIVIDQTTLRRNRSLQFLGELLVRCCTSKVNPKK